MASEKPRNTNSSLETAPSEGAELDALVLRALEKNSEARFAPAAEFRARLVEVADLFAQRMGWLEARAFSQNRPLDAPLEADGEPRNKSATLPSQTARSEVQTWLLFAVGVVMAALTVVALGRLFGGVH
jgi:hypothetical protein